MINKQNFEQFRDCVQSDFSKELLQKSFEKKEDLACMLNYLSFTEDYQNFEIYMSKNKEFLPIHHFASKEDLTLSQVKSHFYSKFLNQGYFFHITPNENVESILENGIISMNHKFKEKLYTDCILVNNCWHLLAQKNNIPEEKELISIPNCKSLYNERFASVYITTNIINALEYYGGGSELTQSFVSSLLQSCDNYCNFKQFSKKDLRNYIIENLKDHLSVLDEKSMHILLSFYDTYYETTKASRYCVENKSIIMIPHKSIKDCSNLQYQKLIQEENNFYNNYRQSDDLEYEGNINPVGLIAISIENDDSLKVYKKEKTLKSTAITFE